MYEDIRQQYLSSLGVDSYYPRWMLPNASVSSIAQYLVVNNVESSSLEIAPVAESQSADFRASSPVVVSSLIQAIDSKIAIPPASDSKPEIVNAASILAQLESPKLTKLQPFSLSIWRISNRVLVIDSRNSKAALPTEQLLKSLLAYCNCMPELLSEDVLQWPMIENRFSSQTENEARQELQTWLSVQLEIHSVQHIWLMGKNAYRYFFDENHCPVEFTRVTFPLSHIPIIVLPSLIELLSAPQKKRALLPLLNDKLI